MMHLLTRTRWLTVWMLMALMAFWGVPQGLAQDYDEALYSALDYRNIGPYRGGRSAAVAGVPGQPMTYYMGATGGGVWKTGDGGQSWQNISDGYFGGSIGAIAVSEWDPNVIYVGGGEKSLRGNVSHGYGMWKSMDAGKTWQQIGLEDTRHIPRVRVHPKNPDLVYVAALGHLSGPNEQRGLFRSKDGGMTWEKILYVNDEVGAFDLVFDPTNPRILYASTWRVIRTPYSLESGGEGSGLWKSTDGGDNWTEITRNDGLPEGTIGISGITVSPVNPERVWAIIEADEGGVFRSEDGGETWQRINQDRNLRQRAWYYTRIYADTQNEDIVYVLNVQFWRSKDGGRTYENINTPHGDHHDLWIAPEDGNRMVIADDGGGQVSFDAGANFSTYMNQPTSQFYRVTTDNHFPYRVLGAQQDNSTVRISHRSDGGAITERDWTPSAGGESGWLAPNPDNPDIVFGGSYGGLLQMVNHATGERRTVNVWPDNPMGHGAEGMKYRFQWNFPIVYSQHEANTLYTGGNILFKTTNDGQTWQPISPDLTRNDPTKLGPSGGPITKDNTGVEYYATIFTMAESPHEAGVIWTGSDDGLIYITRDGGQNWTNVTPPESMFPEWMQVNSIEADPFNPGGLYVAGTRYKLDDFTPYLYKTTDYGQSWTQITNGIDALHFTRVIRADPARQGLLYAGTETGMYISFDDGANWKPFQLNLPIVPITDLALKNNDLVVATQGRSFWILDDLTPLHQLSDQIAQSTMHLYEPRPTYNMPGGGGFFTPRNAGQNPPNGVMIHYYLAEEAEANDIKLRILEDDGSIIRTYTGKGNNREQVATDAGMNRFVWDMSYPDAEGFEGLIMWSGNLNGPDAVPGSYQARLVVGSDSMTVPFEIRKDERASASQSDLQAQFDFRLEVRDKLTETHQSIKQIRDVRAQIDDITKRVGTRSGAEEIKEAGKALVEKITAIEEALYQTKNRSRQDPLNYPIRLNNKLAALSGSVATGNFRPTDQAYQVKEELTTQIDAELTELRTVLQTDLPAFNQLARDNDVPAVLLETEAVQARPAGTN